MRESNPVGCPNFLDKKDTRFRPLQRTLDYYFNKLPKGLQNAAFYTVGKFFCLRGGQEYRCLKLSQLQRGDGKYIYHENVSKNRNGSFRQLHLSAKVVPVFASVEAGERCPVLILDRYIRRPPQETRDKDVFYVRPHEKALPGDDTPWYTAVPLGKHTLQQKVKKLCANAGVVGHKTNHGHPVQQQCTLDALRTYERSNDQQQKEAVSSILSLPQQQKHHRTARKTLDIPVNQTSLPSMPISFGNLQGCTINISNYSVPPNNSTAIKMTETEVDELYSQF